MTADTKPPVINVSLAAFPGVYAQTRFFLPGGPPGAPGPFLHAEDDRRHSAIDAVHRLGWD